MSSTIVLGIYPNQQVKAEELLELKNGFGSAPVIWNAICVTHLNSNGYWNLDNIERLWCAVDDLSTPKHQRAVLTMTFDKAFVARDNFARAASDIALWLVDFPAIEGRVNHWSEIQKLFESNPDIPAIGFRMTTVVENQFVGEYDEENDIYAMIDWSEFFEVYMELEKQ